MERTETQMKILEVGKKEFLEKGFKDASLNQIVAEAGFTKGAFYGYYPDKTALFEDLVGETASELLTRFKAAQDDYFDLVPEGKAKDSLELSTQHLHELVAFMYDHFDEFKLILCRAEGTGYADFIEVLVELEVDRSEEYYALLRKNGMLSGSMTRQLHHMITRAYFTAVCETIVHDMPREEAMKYVDELAIFFHSGWYALATVLLSAAIYFAGLMCTHLAAFRVATNIRKAAVTHLIDLPLGYFNANLTGRLRKQIDDNAALTETLLAHTIPDAVGGIVTPILAVVLLFVFDWRMGLACLIPMIIGLVCLMSMMTGTGMKFFEEYQRAGERISAEATEYVRGIPVVKVFQQTVYSFKSFHAAILSYRDLASGYAMMCRMKPKVFVCDEPTANLDAAGTRQLAQTLRQLKEQGFTLLIAEHRIDWLMGIADRFLYLRDGSIAAEYTPEDLILLPEADILGMGLRSPRKGMSLPAPSVLDESPAVLKTAGLSKRISKEVIFEDVSLSFPEGKVTAITGQNGAGKTTLAQILCGLAKQTRGHILIDGKKARAAVRRREIYYCGNDTSTQFFTASVAEELLLNTRLTEESKSRARSLLKELGLYEYRDAHPSALSGGQKQRLAIACAIFSGRRILILDEPTSGLDGQNMRLIAERLRSEARRGRTILVITHDRELIESCCDNVVEVEKRSS